MLYINHKNCKKVYKSSLNNASKQDIVSTKGTNICSCAQPNGDNTTDVIR